MQPGGRVQLARDEEVLGLAAELIQVPEELKAFIDALLGSVIIVRTRAAARRLAKDLPATARAVTLKGEVFWGSGVVVAGQDGRSGMIARPRQKRELQQTLERVQAELKQVDGHISAYDRQLSEGRSQLTEREKEARQGTQVMNQAVQLHQKAALELEQVRQRTEWQRKQLAGLETQIVQTEKEAQELNASESEMDNQIRQLNDQVRAYNRQLGQLPLDELQAQLNHWRTAAAVSERAAKDAETRLGEYRQALEANARRQSDIARRLVDTASALQQIEDERNAQREQEVELNQAIEALQRDIDPAEAQLQAAEKSYSKLQDNQSAAQQAQTVSERYAAQAQIELARQREAMESLRRRIEDDFGLVALTYETEVVGPTPLPLGDLVAELPIVETVAADLEDNINRQRAQLRRMGAINPEAQSEFHSVKERYDFMKNQVEDLKQADADLRKVIGELDELMKTEFRRTFDAVAAEFKLMFTRLFGGGSARLVLMDEENPIETGVDIEARLPGRREQGLALLSGGERSLTAVALIFSLLKVSPTPFCVMDEVDAALDESNVGRFCELLAELSEQTQFILITHNRNTVQTSGVIYGVTMGRDSASQIISLKLDEVSEEMAQ
jgi:chromosome segregation protein